MYEAETAGWLASTIRAGTVFFDVGAHAGYFTLLGSRFAGDEGCVVAFEPNPENARGVGRQAAVNSVTNVTVERLALSDRTGQAEFTVESETANSHLEVIPLEHATTDPVEVLRVQTSTLDDFVSRSGLRPSVVKIDVEGAEMLVLEGSAKTMAEIRPVCLVSTHTPELKARCRGVLEASGYLVTELPGFVHELIGTPK